MVINGEFMALERCFLRDLNHIPCNPPGYPPVMLGEVKSRSGPKKTVKQVSEITKRRFVWQTF